MNTRYSLGAFTLLELLVVVLLVVVLTAILLPSLDSGRPMRATRCMSNLRQVTVAAIMWSIDHTNLFPAEVSIKSGGSLEKISTGSPVPHFELLLEYRVSSNVFVCPTDETRKPFKTRESFTNENTSYFLNVDAQASLTNPVQVILSGDRHLKYKETPVRPGLFYLEPAQPITWTRELHPQGTNAAGMLAFADGHVERKVRSFLPAYSPEAKAITRLAIP